MSVVLLHRFRWARARQTGWEISPQTPPSGTCSRSPELQKYLDLDSVRVRTGSRLQLQRRLVTERLHINQINFIKSKRHWDLNWSHLDFCNNLIHSFRLLTLFVSQFKRKRKMPIECKRKIKVSSESRGVKTQIQQNLQRRQMRTAASDSITNHDQHKHELKKIPVKILVWTGSPADLQHIADAADAGARDLLLAQHLSQAEGEETHRSEETQLHRSAREVYRTVWSRNAVRASVVAAAAVMR